MAMAATQPHRWTADEVRALPDEPGKRFECVDGELLVSPWPRLPHQSAVYLLARQLDDYCRAHGVGSMFNGPGELELDRFTLVQPDIFVLPLVNGKRALERLTYDRSAKPVTYRSDKSEGLTAGTETADPLKFIARVLVHIPDKGHVMTRYYGLYASRPRGMRQKAAPTRADGPPAIVPERPLAPTVP
jgi:hypothetical protein